MYAFPFGIGFLLMCNVTCMRGYEIEKLENIDKYYNIYF